MKLKELREKHKLTQTALAKALGVSNNTISAIESGRLKLSGKLSGKIKDVYGEVIEMETKKSAGKKPRQGKAKLPAAKPAVKVEKKTESKKKASIVIQSPMGGEITTDAILAKIGEADTVYVRVDQNKAYWVKGEETGSIELW